MNTIKCDAYRSPNKADLYLFVEAGKDVSTLPDTIHTLFEKLELFYTFDLSPGKKMQRENADRVIENIQAQGYHIQMPPPEHEKENILEENKIVQASMKLIENME